MVGGPIFLLDSKHESLRRILTGLNLIVCLISGVNLGAGQQRGFIFAFAFLSLYHIRLPLSGQLPPHLMALAACYWQRTETKHHRAVPFDSSHSSMLRPNPHRIFPFPRVKASFGYHVCIYHGSEE